MIMVKAMREASSMQTWTNSQPAPSPRDRALLCLLRSPVMRWPTWWKRPSFLVSMWMSLALTIGDVLLVGVLRPCRRPEPNGTPSKLWFYDVRTALPADAPSCEDRRDRGRIARQVVEKWMVGDYDTMKETRRRDPVPTRR